MNFDAFSKLVTALHVAKTADTTYLDSMPSQVGEFVATNSLSESLYVQLETVSAAAFGDLWPDVQWFLQEWRPGFEIVCGVDTPAVRSYAIGGLEDYLVYAKKELFPGPVAEVPLSACPLCGGTSSLDWSAVSEYYGRAWQTLHISCNQDGSNPKCDHSVSLDTDSDGLSGKSAALETALSHAWNQVAQALRPQP